MNILPKKLELIKCLLHPEYRLKPYKLFLEDYIQFLNTCPLKLDSWPATLECINSDSSRIRVHKATIFWITTDSFAQSMKYAFVVLSLSPRISLSLLTLQFCSLLLCRCLMISLHLSSGKKHIEKSTTLGMTCSGVVLSSSNAVKKPTAASIYEWIKWKRFFLL